MKYNSYIPLVPCTYISIFYDFTSSIGQFWTLKISKTFLGIWNGGMSSKFLKSLFFPVEVKKNRLYNRISLIPVQKSSRFFLNWYFEIPQEVFIHRKGQPLKNIFFPKSGNYSVGKGNVDFSGT